MADVKERANDAVNEGAAKAKETTDALVGKADEVMSDVRGYAENVLEQSRQGYRQAGAVVRRNPGLSVSTAFGIGVALGVVIGISLRPAKRNDFSSHFHRPSWL